MSAIGFYYWRGNGPFDSEIKAISYGQRQLKAHDDAGYTFLTRYEVYELKFIKGEDSK